jgi:hypothetical protein
VNASAMIFCFGELGRGEDEQERSHCK